MLKVGGEVDSYCSRCELVLAHTIHALVGPRPVKVECNTCHAVHAYRPPPGGPERRAPRPARERPRTLSFDEVLRSKNVAAALRYSPRVTYGLGQVIQHPAFGLGFVSALRGTGKIEVTFRSAVKLLVHDKG